MDNQPELNELSRQLQAIEPGARLVPMRALRRAIRLSRDRGDFHTQVVHERCWRIHRNRLFDLVFRSELWLSPSDSAQEFLLIPIPDNPTSSAAKRELSQTLFHAAVDREFDRAVTAGKLSPETFRDSFGPAQWHSLRTLLLEEKLIGEWDSTEIVFREAVAYAFEVLHIHPENWETFLPGLKRTDPLLTKLSEVLDTDGLFKQTQLPGVEWARIEKPAAIPDVPVRHIQTSEVVVHRSLREAERGNDLLAAICLYRMGDERSAKSLDRLANRLEKLLEFDAEQTGFWQKTIRELLPRAAAGGWPVERRLLYE